MDIWRTQSPRRELFAMVLFDLFVSRAATTSITRILAVSRVRPLPGAVFHYQG
jgi:hypothetical protein